GLSGMLGAHPGTTLNSRRCGQSSGNHCQTLRDSFRIASPSLPQCRAAGLSTRRRHAAHPHIHHPPPFSPLSRHTLVLSSCPSHPRLDTASIRAPPAPAHSPNLPSTQARTPPSPLRTPAPPVYPSSRCDTSFDDSPLAPRAAAMTPGSSRVPCPTICA